MLRYGLREYQAGKFWVYPYVTETDSAFEVTLAVVLGRVDWEAARSNLHAEAVDAELRDQQGRPLTILERPDGWLPVVGGPSLTANARFRFSRAAQESADELVVRVEEADEVVFRWEKRSVMVPEGRRPRRFHLKHLLNWLSPSSHLCIERFGIHQGGCRADANFAGGEFQMFARLKADGDCRCDCFEYRQYVCGRLLYNRKLMFHELPGGPLHETQWQEDGIPHHYPDGKPAYYGHRDLDDFLDTYGPNRQTGCQYRGSDFPGASSKADGSYEADLLFCGQIIDTCLDIVILTRHWRVQCRNFR